MVCLYSPDSEWMTRFKNNAINSSKYTTGDAMKLDHKDQKKSLIKTRSYIP